MAKGNKGFIFWREKSVFYLLSGKCFTHCVREEERGMALPCFALLLQKACQSDRRKRRGKKIG